MVFVVFVFLTNTAKDAKLAERARLFASLATWRLERKRKALTSDHICSMFVLMSSEALVAEQQRQLGALAEMSLAMAGQLQAACAATQDTKVMVRLAEAFGKAGKCMRMCIALSLRLTRRDAPAAGRRRDPDRFDDFDDELDELDERDPFGERLETEQLFDRLPSGPVPMQIAGIARSLRDAAKALPGPEAQDYGARCDAILAETAVQLPPTAERRAMVDRMIATALAGVLPVPRGPPDG